MFLPEQHLPVPVKDSESGKDIDGGEHDTEIGDRRIQHILEGADAQGAENKDGDITPRNNW